MDPLVDRLEKETGLKVEKYEVWHNQENANKLSEYDTFSCGGVPFFFNTETGRFICGEDSYENLKSWSESKWSLLKNQSKIKITWKDML